MSGDTTSGEQEPSRGGRWIGGAVVVVLAVAGGAISTLLFQGGIDPVAETPDPVPPRPTVTPAPARPEAAPRASQRISLEPPPERERPVRPEVVEPTPLTPDMRREMNYFVDDILKASRDDCILPWLDQMEPGTEAEFVIDAVLYDGQMYDVGIRSLDHELPGSVRSCIGDKAWSRDAPELDLSGEIRLQRSASYTARP